MSKESDRPKLSEKGLLTPDNCVVTLIDLQPQMLFGVGSHDRQTIVNSNLVLAKAARVFGVPTVRLIGNTIAACVLFVAALRSCTKRFAAT